jgi:phosphoribosylformylglycinamidine cyclo-ligase
MDYKSSGVDIDAGNEVVRRVKRLAQSTFTSGVLSDIGSFGGLFEPTLTGFDRPVLVASADGVGTKLRVGFMTGRHDTVGRDLVNHCVNDILVQGASPLFFLDYLATGRLSPDVSAAVIEGVASGCRENHCALLGGETAEMPGFYGDGEYDLAGFIVGLVDRSRLIDGQQIEPGDLLVGLPSAGLHTNGYSLARRIVFDIAGLSVDSELDGIEQGATLGDILLRPHRAYLPTLAPLLGSSCGSAVRGLAHITGGGLTENLPRVLPAGRSARIDRSAWVVPPIFGYLQRTGDVSDRDMFRTFNMGIGMVLVCAPADVDDVQARIAETGESNAAIIGRVTDGDGQVEYA